MAILASYGVYGDTYLLFLAFFLVLEPEEEEQSEEQDWSIDSNTIVFTNFFGAGITVATLCILAFPVSSCAGCTLLTLPASLLILNFFANSMDLSL